MLPRTFCAILALAAMFPCSATGQPRIKPAQPGVWPGLSQPEALAVRVLGNYAYLLDAQAGLEIIDVSVPANPVHVGNYNTGQRLSGFELAGTNAVVSDSELSILDLSNPASPQLIGHTTNGNVAIYHLQVAGSHAFTAGYYGLQIVDLTSPTNPVVVGRWEDLPGCCSQATRVQVVGHIAYVTVDTDGGGSGEEIHQAVIDVSDPANPVFLKYLDNIHSFINETREFGHYLLTVDYTPFLNVYDNTDPTNIILVASFPTRSWTFGLTIVGNYAYVPEEVGAVQVFDVSNPTNVVEVAVFDTHGRTQSAFVANDLVYAANWDKGLAIIPSAPYFQFTVEINAQPGVPFTIESATDLGLAQPWSPLLTTNSTRMPFWFTDRDANAPSKFYRVRQP